MNVSAAAERVLLDPTKLVPILLAVQPDTDASDDVLLASLSEALDTAIASKFNVNQWVSTVSRLCGRDIDLLPPVGLPPAKCPDIPDSSNQLSEQQDTIGARLFQACASQQLTSVEATLAFLSIATYAAGACRLTRKGWKEYARKVWDLWHADAKAAQRSYYE